MNNIRQSDAYMASERNDGIFNTQKKYTPIDYSESATNSYKHFKAAFEDADVHNAMFGTEMLSGNRSLISPEFGKWHMDWENTKSMRDMYDPTDMRALSQSGLSKLTNGFMKGLGLLSTTAVAGELPVIGFNLLYGLLPKNLAQSIHKGITGEDISYTKYNEKGKIVNMNPWERFWAKYNSSPVNVGVNKITSDMETTLPNLRTREEQNTPWYERMGTVNFWADDILKNFGFTVGALLSGKDNGELMYNALKNATAGKIDKILTAVGKGRGDARINALLKELAAVERNTEQYAQIEKAIEDIGKIKKWTDFTTRAVSIASASLGEATIESTNLYHDMMQQFANDFDTALPKNEKRYKMEYEGLKDELKKKGINSYEEYVKKKKDDYLKEVSGQALMAANFNLAPQFVVLSFGNAFGLGRQFFKPNWSRATKMANIKKFFTKDPLAKKSIMTGIGKGLWTGLVEGNEEIAQKLSTEWGKGIYGSRVYEMHTDIMNPTIISPLLSEGKFFEDAFKKSYGDLKGDSGLEGFAGFLFGALGLPGGTRTNDSGGRSVVWNDGFIGNIQEVIAENKYREKARKIIEDFNMKGGLKEVLQSAAAENMRMYRANFAAASNDEFLFKNTAYASLLSAISLYESLGKGDEINEQINDIRSILDEYKDTYEEYEQAVADGRDVSDLAEILSNIEKDMQTLFGGQDYANMSNKDKLDIINYFEKNLDVLEREKESYGNMRENLERMYIDTLTQDEITELTKIYLMAKNNMQRARDIYETRLDDDIKGELGRIIDTVFQDYKKELDSDNGRNNNQSLLNRVHKKRLEAFLRDLVSDPSTNTRWYDDVVLNSDKPIESVINDIFDIVRNKVEAESLMKSFMMFVNDKQSYQSMIETKIKEYQKLINNNQVNSLLRDLSSGLGSDSITIEDLYNKLKNINDISLLKALSQKAHEKVKSNPDYLKIEAAVYKRAGDIYISTYKSKMDVMNPIEGANLVKSFLDEEKKDLNELSLSDADKQKRLDAINELQNDYEASGGNNEFANMGNTVNEFFEGMKRYIEASIAQGNQLGDSRNGLKEFYKRRMAERLLANMIMEKQLSNFIVNTTMDWVTAAYSDGGLGIRGDGFYSKEIYEEHIKKRIERAKESSRVRRQTSTQNTAQQNQQEHGSQDQQDQGSQAQNANAFNKLNAIPEISDTTNTLELFDPTNYYTPIEDVSLAYSYLLAYFRNPGYRQILTSSNTLQVEINWADQYGNYQSDPNVEPADQGNVSKIKLTVYYNPGSQQFGTNTIQGARTNIKPTLRGQQAPSDATIEIDLNTCRLAVAHYELNQNNQWIKSSYSYDLHSFITKQIFNTHFEYDDDAEDNKKIYDALNIFKLKDPSISNYIERIVSNARGTNPQTASATQTQTSATNPQVGNTGNQTSGQQSQGQQGQQSQNNNTGGTNNNQGQQQGTQSQPQPAPVNPATQPQPINPPQNPAQGPTVTPGTSIYSLGRGQSFPENSIRSDAPAATTVQPVTEYRYDGGQYIQKYNPTNLPIAKLIQHNLKLAHAYQNVYDGALERCNKVKFRKINLCKVGMRVPSNIYAWGIFTDEADSKFVGIVSPDFYWLVDQLGDPALDFNNAEASLKCEVEIVNGKENWKNLSDEDSMKFSKIDGFNSDNVAICYLQKDTQNPTSRGILVSNKDFSPEEQRYIINEIWSSSSNLNNDPYGRIFFVPHTNSKDSNGVRQYKAYHCYRPIINGRNNPFKTDSLFPLTLLGKALSELQSTVESKIGNVVNSNYQEVFREVLKYLPDQRIRYNDVFLHEYETTYVKQLVHSLNKMFYVVSKSRARYLFDIKANDFGISLVLQEYIENGTGRMFTLVDFSKPDSWEMSAQELLSTIIDKLNDTLENNEGESETDAQLMINVTEQLLRNDPNQTGPEVDFTLDQLFKSDVLRSTYPNVSMVGPKYIFKFTDSQIQGQPLAPQTQPAGQQTTNQTQTNTQPAAPVNQQSQTQSQQNPQNSNNFGFPDERRFIPQEIADDLKQILNFPAGEYTNTFDQRVRLTYTNGTVKIDIFNDNNRIQQFEVYINNGYPEINLIDDGFKINKHTEESAYESRLTDLLNSMVITTTSSQTQTNTQGNSNQGNDQNGGQAGTQPTTNTKTMAELFLENFKDGVFDPVAGTTRDNSVNIRRMLDRLDGMSEEEKIIALGRIVRRIGEDSLTEEGLERYKDEVDPCTRA